MPEHIRKSIREVPDFPKPGILFYDITTLINNEEQFRRAVDMMADHYAEAKIDRLVGIDARGFVFGAALAYRMSKPLVLARKKGKLPYKTIGEEYELEYGTDELHIHVDAVNDGDVVVVVDDLLATGGTARAVANLVKKCGGHVYECAFIVELIGLGGREKLEADGLKLYSLLAYEVDE